MATTTPNFGWDVPQSTDLVKDGATAIAALGNDIDTSLVDLKGGTTGQVLSKTSNTDLDFTWTALTGVDARLTLEESGYYVSSPFYGTSSSTITPTTNTTYYHPVYLSAATYDRLGISIAGYTSTGNARMGIYNCDSSGRPSTVLLDAGVVSITATGIFTVTISQIIATAGWYYLAINRQSGSSTWDGTAAQFSITNTKRNSLSALDAAPLVGYTQASVTGAFATATSLALNTSGSVATYQVRIA